MGDEEGSTILTQKTATIRKSLSPVFDEWFEFDITGWGTQKPDSPILFEVWDWDLGKNHWNGMGHSETRFPDII
jgi:hypothetical protein